MRPDFIPPGQEAAHGIGKTGRYQDYVPGPLPDDLPVDQGGTGKNVPPDLLAPVPTPSPEAIAVPDPGPPASAVMSPGPAAEPEGYVPPESCPIHQPSEAAPPPVAAEVMAQPPAVEPLMVPPPAVEPPPAPPAPPEEEAAALPPPKLTKAEREAIAAKAVEEARRLQEEADRHDEEDVPEAGQKGGQAKSVSKPKGK
jgi:hypothetical protein